MSKWIRGIYNAAANFNMSGSLRAASGRTMGGNRKLVREEREQSNESNITSKSDVATTSTSSSARATSSSSGTPSSDSGSTTSGSSGSTATETRSAIIGNDVIITASSDICDEKCNKCHPTLCDHIERDYAEYTSYTATIRTEGQGAGSRIRVSAEPRYNKQSHSITTDPVEHVTGIQSGVTI